jgi:hypothetical protein
MARFKRAIHMWTAPGLQDLGSDETEATAIICTVC